MSTTAWIVLAAVIAVLFGLSFVVEALLWIAIIAAAVWLVGFVVRGANRTINA